MAEDAPKVAASDQEDIRKNFNFAITVVRCDHQPPSSPPFLQTKKKEKKRKKSSRVGLAHQPTRVLCVCNDYGVHDSAPEPKAIPTRRVRRNSRTSTKTPVVKLVQNSQCNQTLRSCGKQTRLTESLRVCCFFIQSVVPAFTMILVSAIARAFHCARFLSLHPQLLLLTRSHRIPHTFCTSKENGHERGDGHRHTGMRSDGN